MVTVQKDLTKDDFRGLSASLAYELFKTNTLFPLHAAIRAEREDIVFLYLVEHDSQVRIGTPASVKV